MLWSCIFALLSVCFVNGQYEPNWNSLNSRPIPQWYDDAKFGIFIHWGVYSVPAWGPVGSYAEWYWYYLEEGGPGPGDPTRQFHNKTYGADYRYQDFADLFKAELWDVDYWADLFVQSGAKYVVPTSKHHEGFTLWPSAQSWNWNAGDIGPQQDLLKAMMTAFRARGLYASAYFSLYEWFNPLYRGSDPHSYVEQIMLPQLYDLITNYQPDLLWSDGDWEQPSSFWNSTEFLTWLYNESPVKDYVVVNDRWGSETHGVDGGFYCSEYNAQVWLDHKWEMTRGVDVWSFGYNRNSEAGNYTTAYELIRTLIRTVAFGGNFLLDVGPASDGRIPVVMQDRLLAIGNWLQVNGEAIYETRTWVIQGEANDQIFYTQNPSTGAVYAIITSWPQNNKFALSFPQPTKNTEVTLLGYSTPLKYTYNEDSGLVITIPFLSPTEIPSQNAWAFKLTSVNGPGNVTVLQNYWSQQGRTDNALCGTAQCKKTLVVDGYSSERIEGLALVQQTEETQPLTLYFSEENLDFALVLNYNITETGYRFVSIQGYAFPTQRLGTVPLALYWSSQRHDFYTVGSDGSYADAVNNDYVFVAWQGFVFPGPHYLGN